MPYLGSGDGKGLLRCTPSLPQHAGDHGVSSIEDGLGCSTHGQLQHLGLKPRDISVVDGGFEGLIFFMALDNPKKICGETAITLFSNENVLTLASVKSITGIGV